MKFSTLSRLFLVTILLLFLGINPTNANTFVAKFNELKIRSMELAPELNILKAQASQKSAENYSRFTTHLPNANLVLKKEKDFYEKRNVQLRALGIGVYDSSWAINYEWPLLNFTQIQSTRKSFAEKDKANLDLDMKLQEYPIALTTYFLNYLLAKYKTEAVLNSLKKAEAGKKEAQIGFDLGKKTKIDVLRSEANLVSLNSKKTTYLEEEQSAKNQFIEYSGLNQRDLELFSSLNEIQILDLINLLTKSETVKTKATLEQSPTYQSLMIDEKMNRLNLAELTRKEYPDLRIQGSYSNNANSFDGTLHNPYRTHSVALVLTIPLFSGGSFTSAQFETYYAKKQIEFSIAQKNLQVENSLNSTLTKISALETLVESLALNVSQFEELYRLTSKSYQLGKSSLIEILEVQDNLLDSKISLAQNKILFYSLSQNYIWQAGL